MGSAGATPFVHREMPGVEDMNFGIGDENSTRLPIYKAVSGVPVHRRARLVALIATWG